jgi:hypothetical protein
MEYLDDDGTWKTITPEDAYKRPQIVMRCQPDYEALFVMRLTPEDHAFLEDMKIGPAK